MDTLSHKKLIAGCAMLLPMPVNCLIFLSLLSSRHKPYEYTVDDFFKFIVVGAVIFPWGSLFLLFIPGAALIISHFKGAPFTRTMAAVTFAPAAFAASINLAVWTIPGFTGLS